MNTVTGFLTGWFTALRYSLPDSLQRALGIARAYRLIEPSANGFTLTQMTGASFGTAETQSDDGLAAAVTRFRGPTVLVLPEDAAIRASLTLPDSATKSLDQVLDVEIERLTPFRASDVTVSKSIEAAGPGRIKVGLTVAPRNAVTPHIERLAAAGVQTNQVVAGRHALAGAEIDALSGVGTVPVTSSRIGAGGLLTACLALAAAASPFVWQSQEASRLFAELAALEPETRRILDVAREVEDMEMVRAAAHAFRASRVPMTTLFEDVSRGIPDDSWLLAYRYDASGLKLEGKSAAATALIGALNSAPRISGSTFDARINRDPSSGTETFRIIAKVRRP